MQATTNFIDWLTEVEPENHEEVYSLYRSINDCDEWSCFKTEEARGNGWIVSASHMDQPLLLASEKAKKAFLIHIEKAYCDDLEMEGWYAFMHAMAKND